MASRLIVLCFGMLLLGIIPGSALADSKSGEAKFTGPKKETVKVSLGEKEKVKLDAEFEMITVGQLTGVSVRATVKNTANTMMHYSYNVAFLDKDKNLIGCQNFSVPLQGMQDGTAGTFILLPPDEIAKIAYYSVALHQGDKPIGSSNPVLKTTPKK